MSVILFSNEKGASRWAIEFEKHIRQHQEDHAAQSRRDPLFCDPCVEHSRAESYCSPMKAAHARMVKAWADGAVEWKKRIILFTFKIAFFGAKRRRVKG